MIKICKPIGHWKEIFREIDVLEDKVLFAMKNIQHTTMKASDELVLTQSLNFILGRIENIKHEIWNLLDQ